MEGWGSGSGWRWWWGGGAGKVAKINKSLIKLQIALSRLKLSINIFIIVVIVSWIGNSIKNDKLSAIKGLTKHRTIKGLLIVYVFGSFLRGVLVEANSIKNDKLSAMKASPKHRTDTECGKPGRSTRVCLWCGDQRFLNTIFCIYDLCGDQQMDCDDHLHKGSNRL